MNQSRLEDMAREEEDKGKKSVGVYSCRMTSQEKRDELRYTKLERRRVEWVEEGRRRVDRDSFVFSRNRTEVLCALGQGVSSLSRGTITLH